jgi:tetratricopeptide (TPR) repeat protein
MLSAGCANMRTVAGEKNPDVQQKAPEAKPMADQPAGATGKTGDKTSALGAPGSAQNAKGAEASAEYHFSLAQAYVADGNPDRAIEEFKITLMFDPGSALVYARLASEYVKKGMLSAAMETCKEALQRDEDFVDARLMLAGLYATTHESQAALNEYDKVLKKDPKHEEATVYKAQVLLEDGRAQDAIKTLEIFTKKAPDSVLGWYYLARAHEHENHFKEAVRSYRKAIEMKPGFSQAILSLGYLFEENQMNEQALGIYKELWDNTQDVMAAGRIATLLLKDEKYELAVPYLDAIATSDPEDMNARVKLGLVQMQLKNFEKAIATFKEILAKNPESDRIHYYLGSLYEETKNFDQAIAELKQIGPESKLYNDAAIHVAFLMKTKDPAGARGFMKEAIAKSPKNPNFYVFAASLDEETKNVEGAVKTLEDAVAKFPEDEKIRYYLGSLYDRQGKAEKGMEQMEAILKVNPDNVDALNYIGYTWTMKGTRLNDAERLLRRALTLRPDSGYIQDSWGWYLFVRGRVSEAVVELEKAAKLKPNESTILEHLADAYMRSNLRQKALLRYKDAAKYADDDEARRKLEGKVENLTQELVNAGQLEKQDRVPAGGEKTPKTQDKH